MKSPTFSCFVITTLVATAPALAVVTPPAGYIYSTELLGSTTESCVAAGPGGTFVAIGPGFTANAQAVVQVNESGTARLVAFGFNSVSDCAYDLANDVLYVTDNADAGELPGALTGDTVFAIPSASTASGVPALGLEVVPANSVPSIASVVVDAGGDVFVSNATGGGAGTVQKIDTSSPSLTPFASGFEFTAGLAIEPATGNVFAADSFPNFDSRIRHFTAAGTELPVFAGPSPAFGSYDLAFTLDGRLVATGKFGGDVVVFDGAGTSSPFVSGLNFATGITVNHFTGRVEILSSFSGTDEDRSLHRFTPISQLAPGAGSASTECLNEVYGLDVSDSVATCVDGSACDADGKVNDSCLFPIGFCLNVDDPVLSACTPATQVTDIDLSSKPASAAISAVAARIAGALPVGAASCFFSDGLAVPVKITGSGGKKAGKGKIKVHATADDGRKDADSIKLVCQPAP